MADFIRCPRCDRLFTVGDGEPLGSHYNKDGVVCAEKPQGNHPTHIFVSDWDMSGDCARCIGCDVRSGSRHAIPPCPGIEDAFNDATGAAQPYGERGVIATSDIVVEELYYEGNPKQYNIPPVKPSVFGSGKRAITGCEQTLVWDSDSCRYLHSE